MRGFNPTEQEIEELTQRARAGWRRNPGSNPIITGTPAGTPTPEPPTSDEPESTLQKNIVRWAKRKGYPCQCFRQSRKARGFLVPGWFD